MFLNSFPLELPTQLHDHCKKDAGPQVEAMRDFWNLHDRRWRAVNNKNSAVKSPLVARESELWSHTKPERGRCSKTMQSNHQPYGVRTEWQRLCTWNNLVIWLHSGRKSGSRFKPLENLTRHYNTLHSGCSSWFWGSCRKLKLILMFLTEEIRLKPHKCQICDISGEVQPFLGFESRFEEQYQKRDQYNSTLWADILVRTLQGSTKPTSNPWQHCNENHL